MQHKASWQGQFHPSDLKCSLWCIGRECLTVISIYEEKKLLHIRNTV